MLKTMPPFWISIAVLSLAQGVVVAIPRALASARARGPAGAGDAALLAPLRARGWAAIPPVSVLAFVLIAGAAQRASAQALTYLALVAVPALALLALVVLARPAPRARAALGAAVAAATVTSSAASW